MELHQLHGVNRPGDSWQEYDVDAANAVDLDDDALNMAVEAATEAHVAGLDEHDQLVAGLKAYVWVMENRNT